MWEGSGKRFAMDQKKIGDFISQRRKNLNLTQKELAEQLHVSDKAISKWETGKGMPEMDSLMEICKVLDVSFNELLAGEKLPVETYERKAEENMMQLLQENEENRRCSRKAFLVGIVLAVFALCFMLVVNYGMTLSSLTYYMDFPTILLLLLFSTSTVLLSGAKSALEIVKVLQKAMLPVSVLVAAFEVIAGLHRLDSLDCIGPMIAVIVLSFFFGALGYLILLPVRTRLEQGKMEK